MKIKRLLTVAVSAVMLAGMGLYARTSYHANADQPYRIIRYLNNRNARCYYGYNKKIASPTTDDVYYQKGYAPRSMRRGHFVMLVDPYFRFQRSIATQRIHGRKYYIDDTYNKNTRKRTYFSLFIPTNAISRYYKKRNARLYRIYNARERRDNYQIRRHKHNKRLVNKYSNDKWSHFLVYNNLKYNRHNR